MSGAQVWLFFAVLVQVALTLVLYPLLLRSRIAAVKAGGVDPGRAAYDSSVWPARSRALQNAVASQFELPVLFYVAAALAYALGGVNWITVILAWVFVLSRIVHAIIHIGPNAIYPRLGAFLIGWIAIILLWVWLALHVISGAQIGA